MPMIYRELKNTKEYKNASAVEIYGDDNVMFSPDTPEEWLDKQPVSLWDTHNGTLKVKLFENAEGGIHR